MVCLPEETAAQSAVMGIRAGMDRALHYDGDSRGSGVAQGRARQAREDSALCFLGADALKFPVVIRVLRNEVACVRPGCHSAFMERDSAYHSAFLSGLEVRGLPADAVHILGELRILSERRYNAYQ